MSLSYFLITIFIVYRIVRIVRSNGRNTLGNHFQLSALREYKSTCNRYTVYFDYCVFKEERFTFGEEENTGDIRLVSRFVKEGNLQIASGLPVIENSLQAVLYYQHPDLNIEHPLRQSFPMEISSLKYYIRRNELYVYIRSNEPKEYMFDIA